MDYQKAEKIIKEKLEKMGIKFEKEYSRLRGLHFKISLDGVGYWKPNYEKVNLSISTINYKPNSYKNFRRYLRRFDIKTGDYIKLQQKIDLVIKKDKEFKRETEEQEHGENKEFARVLKLFKKYNPKEVDLASHKFELEFPNLHIRIDTDINSPIEFDFTGDYFDLIKMVGKLKGEK